MVLGVTDQWARRFEGIALTPPEWYGTDGGFHGTFSPTVFSRALSTDMMTMAGALKSAPDSGGTGEAPGAEAPGAAPAAAVAAAGDEGGPMYCDACGEKIADSSRFCPACGARLEEMAPNGSAEGMPAAAHSAEAPAERPSDFADLNRFPELTRHMKKSRKIGRFFVLLNSAAPFVGFMLYAAITGEMEMEEALFVGIGVSCIFSIFSILFAIKERARQVSWVGTVVDKRIERRKERVREYDETRMVMVDHRLMTIQREDRSKREVRDYGGNAALFDYYSVGDRVRQIPGAFHLEKQDKRRDDEVICVLCGGLYDKDQDKKCGFCRLPLLK